MKGRKNAANRGYLRRPFDSVLATGTDIAVLRALAKTVLGGTGREIARMAGVAPQAAHNALARLESRAIVRRQPAGKAYLFELNRDHYLVKNGLLPLLDAEAGFRDLWETALATAVEGDIVAGIIFGSMARGEEGTGSDLDLCLIVGVEARKERVREKIDAVFQEMWTDAGLRVSPLLVTWPEFVAGYRRGDALYRDITREGDVFVGRSMREIVNGPKDAAKAGRSARGRKLRRRGD